MSKKKNKFLNNIILDFQKKEIKTEKKQVKPSNEDCERPARAC